MLILDEHELEYLKDLLNANSYFRHKNFWAKEKILGKIKDEEERKTKQANCSHEMGKYHGEKTCCVKCGSFGDNQGFSWTLDSSEAVQE